MRVVEHKMIEAMRCLQCRKFGNTEVRTDNGVVSVYLHGNRIATVWDGGFRLSDCGWRTNTTKSRLNALLDFWGYPRIYQKNFEWYVGNEEWTGTMENR
jgi:hypothetical protein